MFLATVVLLREVHSKCLRACGGSPSTFTDNCTVQYSISVQIILLNTDISRATEIGGVQCSQNAPILKQPNHINDTKHLKNSHFHGICNFHEGYTLVDSHASK